MTARKWCEHCRDHYDGDHYDDHGRHKVGVQYGPTGVSLRRAEIARNIVTAIEIKGSHPEYHDRVRRRHRDEWKSLWRELDELVRLEEAVRRGGPPG